MSTEMAERKKLEIETLANREKLDKEMIRGDVCPVCGQRPTSYPYICFLPNPYGWLECVACGTIYVPKSIRDQKIAAQKHTVQKPKMIVTGE